MLWIGITGPMGSGKSTVALLLRQMGYEVLDADAEARKVLGPGTTGEAEVLRSFGQILRDDQGHLDRRALGRLVFADRAQLAKLEAIVHPLVQSQVAAQRRQLAARGVGAAFYDVPLLFEKKLRDQFDLVLVVSAAEEFRARRLKARSQMTDDEIQERGRHHLSPEAKEAQASAVIRNDGDLVQLEKNLRRVLKDLKIPLAATSPG
jgi:dephospho-CoA kinase